MDNNQILNSLVHLWLIYKYKILYAYDYKYKIINEQFVQNIN